MTINISLVNPDRRALALRLLFARFPLEEQATRLDDALRNAERGSLNLDGLLLAEEGEQPIGAALMMIQADGVALVWPPVISCQTKDVSGAEHALMSRLCEEIDRAGAKLSQCLLEPDDVAEIELLQGHGFVHSADIFFLARPLTPDDCELGVADGELDLEFFCDSNADRYASVIESTYVGSLDCQFLNGFRSGSDALVSHKLSGRFDPSHWHLYRRGTDDYGVLLLNEHPDQDAIELVYFGIIPQYRGQGFGRRLLFDGVRTAAKLGRSVMFLAVDCGNTYANSLYSELGFAELARRRVMIRCSSELARK
jgi:GNAT superfamily N-acetyltransferase